MTLNSNIFQNATDNCCSKSSYYLISFFKFIVEIFYKVETIQFSLYCIAQNSLKVPDMRSSKSSGINATGSAPII